MVMRVKSQREVRLFAAVVLLVVLLGSLLLRMIVLPPDLAAETILPGSLMAVMISAPIAFLSGSGCSRFMNLPPSLSMRSITTF